MAKCKPESVTFSTAFSTMVPGNFVSGADEEGSSAPQLFPDPVLSATPGRRCTLRFDSALPDTPPGGVLKDRWATGDGVGGDRGNASRGR